LGTPLGVRCVFYVKSSAAGGSAAYHELKLVEHRQRGLPGVIFRWNITDSGGNMQPPPAQRSRDRRRLCLG